MLCMSQFEKIKEKYGSVASWAIWDTFGEKPKSNIGNMDIFELDKNNNLLHSLKPNVVMVGLNFSREVKIEKPFMNRSKYFLQPSHNLTPNTKNLFAPLFAPHNGK